MAGVKYNKAFASLGHECEMLAEDDAVEQRYPEKTCADRIKKIATKSILVNERICKSCAIHLRSHGAIEKEKNRHITEYPQSIHPFSKARIGWDTFMLLINFLQLILIPLDVAYFAYTVTLPFFSSLSFLVTRTILDLICCLDVFVNARTGYYDESKKEVILDPKTIFKHYLRTKFVLDVLASIPTHVELLLPRETTTENVDHPILITAQMISLIKYIRFFTFNKLATKLCNIYGVDFYWRHGVLMVTTTLLFWHILSCTHIFGYVLFQNKKAFVSYINKSTFTIFARSMYEGALLLYTASYGIDTPQTTSLYLMVTAAWFISKFVQIYLLARIIEFLRAITSPRMKYSQMVKQLIEFMRHKQLPLYTQKRILTYYEFHFQKSYFRENEIYATISGQLRQEIVMQTCRQLVENVEFFRDLPMNLLVRIVSCLKSEIYLTNDVVVKGNTTGNCMYFISTGTVAVYTVSGKEICHLEDGDHFGEFALINSDAQRLASVIAVETCELYRLDRKDFIKAIHPYPDLMEKIQKIAADRMEKTNIMDEHYKQEIINKRFQ